MTQVHELFMKEVAMTSAGIAVRGFAVGLGVWCLAMPAMAGPIDSALRGQILDSGSKSPVSRAEVTLTGDGLRTITDQEGRFVFQGLSPGAHSLKAEHVGYQGLLMENVKVEPGQAVQLTIEMRRIVTLLENVTVTPGAFSFMEGGTNTRQTMSRDDIESVPQIGEDIFRAVNRIPGLSSGDYSAHFSIRGGRHDETLILLDGLELHEPYHLKDFNEGAVSIIDTQTIDGVELLTGGFSAQYGNKNSGVMNITSRTPESDQARFSAGLSVFNARAMGRGPLWDGKGSWLFSARSGYMDLVFSLIKQKGLPSPRYQDFFAKLQRSMGTKHVWSLDILHARDRYTFDAAATTGPNDSLRTRENALNRYGNSYAWTTLTSSLGRRTTARTQLSAGLVTRNRDGSEKYVDLAGQLPLYTLTNKRDYSILAAKQDWTFRLSDSLILQSGIDARRLHNTDTFRNAVGPDPDDPADVNAAGLFPVITNTRFEKGGSRVGLYLSSKWRVKGPLTLELGARHDRASYTGDRNWSPRTGASLDLGGGRTLRVGWGRYRQMQGIDEVAVLNDKGRFFQAERSEQWTGGLEQTLGPRSLLRIEGYLKNGSGLRPVYRNWRNAPDTFPETNEDRILVFPNSSKSRGVELYFTRDLGRRLAMRTSYAYAISEEQADRIQNINRRDVLTFDPTHPTPQDQRHAANMDFTYSLSSWSLNGSLAYHSGWPGTLEALLPVTTASRRPTVAVRPVQIYGSRLPSYFRFDLRATKKWKKWHAFIEVVNATNHNNVWGYNYVQTPDSTGKISLVRTDEKWFTILPSIGVSWSR